MSSDYSIRRAKSDSDGPELNALFTEVFHPEAVGVLAETMFYHLPGMARRYWFIAEEDATGSIVAAFTLIPWTWELAGVQIKVAEMGIVGTREAHRGRGLMRLLNAEFDRTLADEGFDLAVIQGIPGFYQQFGYSYAVPLENQINLPLHLLPDPQGTDESAYRLANNEDIPFLMAEDDTFRAAYALSAYRDEAHWRYMLNESRQTEYGSEFWIMKNVGSAKPFYCRIPQEGFGTGLIVSEISEDIPYDAFRQLLAFCKRLADERQKPYIRLNLLNESAAGKMAITMGAKPGRPYAWQIKVPDAARLFRTIAPALERRLQASSFANLTGRFRLNFYRHRVDLEWSNGRLASVGPGSGASDYTLSLPADLLPALCLGHRSWQELRHIRPDIRPGSDASALLVEALFPPAKSWIHEQY